LDVMWELILLDDFSLQNFEVIMVYASVHTTQRHVSIIKIIWVYKHFGNIKWIGLMNQILFESP
jgi:hypothetical protein